MTSDVTDPAANTDRELWREADDYDANSIHVTEQGGIGMSVAGSVIVKPIADWHALAARPLTNEVEGLRTMRQAFRTTQSGDGKFLMTFRFRSMRDMHKADDEWRQSALNQSGGEARHEQ